MPHAVFQLPIGLLGSWPRGFAIGESFQEYKMAATAWRSPVMWQIEPMRRRSTQILKSGVIGSYLPKLLKI
jgi:hypothetical protein